SKVRNRGEIMHKEEASKLFASLGDGSRVKIVKMLYHNPVLSLDNLCERMDMNSFELKAHLNILCEVGLISKTEEQYSCNKELVDTLLSFIPTKCGCCS
ncbi:MAG: helix-turn-helix domain-containing protein, partial [Anaeroplasmataceae bacterium]|nr:helix-turn-helix domain-containing protein [Anaeroplasmataceae bacterium]